MNLESIHPSIHFRPISENDIPILQKIYYSTRQTEMDMVVDWSPEQKEFFLLQQFTAQHLHYQEHYPNAYYGLILKEHEIIGRLYLNDHEGEVRIIDIALLPAFRNQGIGSSILFYLQDKAKAENKSISIHVEGFNPALNWYQRMGFIKIDEHGIYHFMRWKP